MLFNININYRTKIQTVVQIAKSFLPLHMACVPFNTTYMKEKVIELVKTADINIDCWFEDIVRPLIKNTYACGYLDAKIEDLSSIFKQSNEEYREEILKICDYDIWD